MGGRNIVDPRSAEQGGLGEGYGQNTMPSTVYNMFKEGDFLKIPRYFLLEYWGFLCVGSGGISHKVYFGKTSVMLSHEETIFLIIS
ncbi:hypothetical protein [Bacteroides rodentium]